MQQGELKDALERIVDESTLAAVVNALADVCAEKAEQIRTNWQDKNTARPWDKASSLLAQAVDKIDV